MEFVNWIKNELKLNNWSQNELARRAGVRSSTVSLVFNGLRKPGLDFCQGVAQALKIPTEEVLRRADLLQPYSEDIGDATLIEIYKIAKNLRSKEQEELLTYLQQHYSK